MNGAPVAPALIIAAPSSGSGKTLVTLALLRHLYNKGIDVQGAKVGPDYIDPAFHKAACRKPCPNLDPWGMREETLKGIATEAASGVEFLIVEGVMGLFDGATPTGGRGDGSTAALAEITGWPILLVVDAARQAASAAVTVKGFREHRPGARVVGVIFNRVGGDRHARLLRSAMLDIAPEVTVVGCLPRLDDLELPSRHLGLVQAAEHPDIDRFLDFAAEWIGEHLDIDAVTDLGLPWPALPDDDRPPPLPPLGQRIFVAQDDAFSFAYPTVIDGWRRAGANVHTFSPLRDEAPAANADAVYLPGGYPELHAGRLAANWAFMEGMKKAAERGTAIFGECGGYMVMGRALIDADGRRHPMTGLLPLETSFQDKKLHLGYRRVTLAKGGPLGGARSRFRGHEFHYASIVDEGPGIPLFRAETARGEELAPLGLADGRVMGSFVHLIDAEAPT